MSGQVQDRGALGTPEYGLGFRQPPVVEVVLAVSFPPIPGFRLVDYGGLWDRYFRDKFPKVTAQPALQPLIEHFDAQGAGPVLSLELGTTPPMPRAWFVSSDESELIQVQTDWFARNWRKVESDQEYPRYPRLREPFAEAFREFAMHVEETGLGSVRPTQCEITYVNHVVTSDELPLSEILSVVRAHPTNDLPLPEAIRIAVQYVIEWGNQPIGRLHVSAEPAIRRADGKPVTVVTLTARGKPLSEGVQGVLEFFDLGHERVVRAFELLTTERMHELWGRHR